MPTRTFAPKYYLDNEVNRQIASTSTGVIAGQPPINEIVQRGVLAGTITSTAGSTAVTGASTLFNNLQQGDMLFTSVGAYIGTVDTIQSQTALTLKQGAVAAVTAAAATWARVLPIQLGSDKGFLVAVPTVKDNVADRARWVPTTRLLRSPASVSPTATGDQAMLRMAAFSQPGNWGVPASPQTSVPYTVTVLNNYAQSGNTMFPNAADLPEVVWLFVNPYGNTAQRLSPLTDFIVEMETNLDAVLVDINGDYGQLVTGGLIK